MAKTFGKDIFYVNKDLMRVSKGKVPKDRLRNLLKKYYTLNDDGVLIYENNFNQSSLVSAEVRAVAGTPVLVFDFLREPEDDEQTQDFQIALGSLIDTSDAYWDYHWQGQEPIEVELLEESNNPLPPNYIDARAHYGFYVARYEAFLATNPLVSENVLPNFYTIYAQAHGQGGLGNLNYLNGNFTTKGQEEDSVFQIEQNLLTVFRDDIETVKGAFGDYFTEFAQDANNLIKKEERSGLPTARSTLDRLAKHYNTYIFNPNMIPLLTSEAVKGEMFPLYNEIRFSTDVNSKFADLFYYFEATQDIVNETIMDPQGVDIEFELVTETTTTSDIIDHPPDTSYESSASTVPSWDMKKWIRTNLFSGRNFSGVELGKFDEDYDLTALGQTANQWGLGGSFQSLVAEVFRSLRDMMDGKPCYSETIFYKIQKFKEDDLKNPLTTYYVPNSSGLDECRFIDTQVKYNIKYRYVITSYVLVVGNQYSYNTFNEIGSTRVNVGIGTVPEVRLLEVPLSVVKNLSVMDAPPMMPESSIVSYKNIGNKILINMNGSTGDRDMVPVIINPSDQEQYMLLSNSQKRTDDKIRFKSDDASTSFEVFRTTKLPSSYADFAGKKIRDVLTKGQATSAAIEDDISPNVKYYYTLRSIDVHGNASNPSPVYEIEMKSKSGPPYMVTRIIDFQEQQTKNKKPFKTMRRYVQIIPTTPQGLLDVETSGLQNATTANGVESISLGVSDEKLWGKEFRFRFTSKKTGRKIDLDVNFKTEHQLKQS